MCYEAGVYVVGWHLELPYQSFALCHAAVTVLNMPCPELMEGFA